LELSQCLRFLTHLELELPPSGIFPDGRDSVAEYVQRSMFVVGRVAECLPLLQDVVFWAGLDVRKVNLLSRLRHLERLSSKRPLGCVVGLDSYEADFNDHVIRRTFQDIPRVKAGMGQGI
jgi:hypothetical protein